MQWPRRNRDRELDQELAHHLETLAEGYRRQGLPEAEAMRLAKIDFGGVEAARDECREIRGWTWLTHLGQDLRFGLRMLRRTPTLTAAALLSLALGIGATTAILTLADAVLWRTLAIPSPEQFYEVFWEAKGDGYRSMYRGSSGSGFRDGALQVGDYFSMRALDAMRERAAGKAEVASHEHGGAVSASFQGAVVVTNLRAVSGNFFSVLQLHPAVGRLLTEQDDSPAAAPVAVVTHGFWQRHLGGSVDAVGKTIRINNTVYEIAGVLPASFFGIVPGDNTEIYTPTYQSPQWLAPDSWYRTRGRDPMTWWKQLVIRRAPGTNASEVREAMDAGFSASWASRPETPESTPRIRLVSASHGLGDVRRQFGDPVLILFGLVALVLTVACENIANLLLARSVSRERETALRLSLGCGKSRLMRQHFTESLLLAGLGGALSLPVAWMLTRLMLNFMPEGFESMLPALGPDLRMLAATAAVTILAAFLFGLYPAFRGTRVNVAPALKEGAGSANTASRQGWASAKALVMLQVSLGVLLLTAATLFTGHLWEVLHRETGFAEGQMLLFDIRPGEAGHEGERLRQFYLNLEDRLQELPGVEAVGLSRTRPMRGGGYSDGVKLVGSPNPAISTRVHHATAGFLSALGVPVISGREITQQEVRNGAKVAVISKNLAKELGESAPVGLQLSIGGDEFQVVGVAREARYSRMTETDRIAYIPMDYQRSSATMLLRTSLPPLALLSTVRGVVRELDRELPLVDVYTMEQQISRTLQRERLFAWLCGSFGVLALVLCVVGLYGLFSYTTARRSPEIGIRIAVGASRRAVLRQVMSEGLRLTLAGLLAGIPLALYCASIAESRKLLPEGQFSYWALAAALGILVISAALAVLAPAIRAASVDPVQALRRGG